MTPIQGFLFAVSVVLILAVLVQVRRAHIRVEYSVSWLVAGLSLLLVSGYPGLLRLLAETLHLEQEPLPYAATDCGLYLLVCIVPAFDRGVVIEGQQHRAGPASGYSRISHRASS